MHTIAVHVRVPFSEPPGAGNNGSSFSGDDLLRRQQEQRRVIDAVSPFLSSLPAQPLHRAGNVSAVTLLGGDVSSGFWSLLVLVDVDSAAPGLEEGLLKILPARSEVSVLGSFGQIAAGPRRQSPIEGYRPMPDVDEAEGLDATGPVQFGTAMVSARAWLLSDVSWLPKGVVPKGVFYAETGAWRVGGATSISSLSSPRSPWTSTRSSLLSTNM